MIIFAIIGVVMIFWFILEGMVRLIPWLILAVIVTTCLGFIIEHWIISIILLVVAFLIVGVSANYKDTHKTPQQLADEAQMKEAEDLLKSLDDMHK